MTKDELMEALEPFIGETEIYVQDRYVREILGVVYVTAEGDTPASIVLKIDNRGWK